MERLYQIQQRLGMTNAEAAALGVILGLFILGSGARYIMTESPVFDDTSYAEVDSLFALGISRMVGTEEPATQPSSDAEPGPAVKIPVVSGSLSIDVNTASPAELQRLPGIGPALADRIIEHREAIGRFSSINQLTAVRGIGPKTLERMRPHLREPPSAD